MNIDMNLIREIVTVASFVTFMAILAWALDPRRKSGFDQAARAPLEDE